VSTAASRNTTAACNRLPSWGIANSKIFKTNQQAGIRALFTG
jgi:hypothetical protein